MDMCYYGLSFFECIQNLHEQVQRHRHPHSVASTIPPWTKSDTNIGVFTGTLN